MWLELILGLVGLGFDLLACALLILVLGNAYRAVQLLDALVNGDRTRRRS